MHRATSSSLRIAIVLSVAATAALAVAGCAGGHAPTLPSPDAPPAPEDVIEVEDYVVEAREVVRLARSTIIRAANTACIDGDVLVFADASGVEGNVSPTRREQLAPDMYVMAVWEE